MIFVLGILNAPFLQAQSVDSCMEAKVAEAINLCQSILDNGSRNANVYHKLASALYQSGQTDRAKTVLNKAGSLYPGNENLKSLTKLINSSMSEQDELDKSAKKNEDMIAQGKSKIELKVACLTKTGNTGINACRQYLTITDVDAEKIKARLAELGAGSKTINPKPPVVSERKELPTTSDKPSTPAAPPKPSEPVIVTRPTPPVNSAQREAVITAQQLLNDLGFAVGLPDGIAGERTKQALINFYSQIGQNSSGIPVNNATLQDLDKARSEFVRAEQLLADSRRAEADEDFLLAISNLDEASATSKLFNVPSGYAAALHSKLLAQQTLAGPQTTDEVTIPVQNAEPDTQEPVVQITTPATSDPIVVTNTAAEEPQSTEQFNQLLAEIRLLTQKLDTQSRSHDQQLNAIRASVKID